MSYVRSTKGLAVMGFADSGHSMPMDTISKVGGLESAAAPMEVLLQSLMGCTMMDVVSILKKMKVEPQVFEIHEEHDQAEEHPRVYTRIELDYRFEGEGLEEAEEKVRKAVGLSQERYCPVSAMLSKVLDISYSIRINGKIIKGADPQD